MNPPAKTPPPKKLPKPRISRERYLTHPHGQGAWIVSLACRTRAEAARLVAGWNKSSTHK